MPQYNLQPTTDIDTNYSLGLLPQRNDKNNFYSDSSCRSNLSKFVLSSENRRILRKTDAFTYKLAPISYNLDIQKLIFHWLKELKWDFPISSVKTIFTNHLFNQLYIWKFDEKVVAYSICYFSPTISHIAYVFYNPQYSHSDLPIRLVLQTIIDSQQLGLKYCYLGRFSNYKRNMPGFENFENNQWL
jgi:arginyl-tRNA--protein-N-Asp/Glu arginylyltransferase